MLHELGLWWLPGFDSGEGGSSTPSPPVYVGNPRPVICAPTYSDVGVLYSPIFSGGGWEPTMPISNMQDSRLSRISRSLSLSVAHTQFDVDLRTQRYVGGCIIPKHNIGIGGQYRWIGAADLAGLASPLADSGWIDACPMGTTEEDFYGINSPIVYLPDSSIQTGYWRCQINALYNTVPYVDIHRVLITGAYDLPTGISAGAKLGLETMTERIVTDGGSALYRPKAIRRSWDWVLNNLTEDQMFNNGPFKLMRQLSQHKQAFVVFDREDPHMHERGFLCTIRELSGVEYPYANYHSIAFRFLEEL